MPDYQLFFGFFLSDFFLDKLNQLSTSITQTFIQAHTSAYLQKIEHEGRIFLGKFVGAAIELVKLELLEAHIYSLLKKIVPDFPYEKTSLVLFATFSVSSDFKNKKNEKSVDGTR